MRFLAERSGKPYPVDTYTQVFTHGTVEQEAVGMTLLPETYAADLAQHPENLWLLAHELAHQWYGIEILAKDWSDFWLSEGMATFLADAFLEQRFGKARYDREIADSRQIYDTLRAQGRRPAAFLHRLANPAAGRRSAALPQRRVGIVGAAPYPYRRSLLARPAGLYQRALGQSGDQRRFGGRHGKRRRQGS